MENASKALLIAGGVLLTMIVVVILIFARGKFGDFYNKEDELGKITDISEFNLQFSNYDRDDVHGYELISLSNRIADYNMRYSNDANAMNNEKYNPITINIKFPGETAKALWYDETPRTHFFNYNQTITQSSTINQILNIIEQSHKVEELFGNSNEASKVAKSISVLTDQQRDYYMTARKISQTEAEKIILDYYNSLVKTETAKASSYSEIKYKITQIANIYEYYEYYQLKKAIFKCTGITYDSVSNRVSTISFEFTGDIE